MITGSQIRADILDGIEIGTGNYISRDNFSTSSSATSASTALNITKTGTGTQTFTGVANLGAVTVNAGKMIGENIDIYKIVVKSLFQN